MTTPTSPTTPPEAPAHAPPGGDAPVQYETAKGCLMLGGIGLIITIATVVAVVLLVGK